MNEGFRRDIPLLIPMAILIGLGWVMVFSTAAVPAVGGASSGVFYHLKRQMLATGLGAVAIMFFANIPLARLERHAPAVLAATVVLMLAVFLPGVGKHVARASRWINFGFVSFQPVELFKPAVVLCYASLLSRMRPRGAWTPESWAKLAGLAVLSLALPNLQRDFGSVVLMLCMGAGMIWLAGARMRYLVGFGAAGAFAAVVLLLSHPYRVYRIKQYLSSWGGTEGGGYQTTQSLIALGAGGLFGVGLGESSQKLFFLPSAHADFIFAIIGEELGFIGAIAVLVLYFLLLREGLRIAQQSVERFSRLLASGLILLVFTQGLWHITVALVLVPTKGLALPFVSYGGSSLMCSMLIIGIILRCAAESGPAPVRPAQTGSLRIGSVRTGSVRAGLGEAILPPPDGGGGS